MSKFKRLKNEKQIKAGLYIRVLSNAYGKSIEVLKVKGGRFIRYFDNIDYTYLAVKTVSVPYEKGDHARDDIWGIKDLLGYEYASAVYPFSNKLLNRLLKMDRVGLVEFMGEKNLSQAYISTLEDTWHWEREDDDHFDY